MTLKLVKQKVPMIVTNHTYDQMGTMFPQKVMGGRNSLQYAASTIVFLSKRKEKDGTDVIGNIIHCRLNKSRLTKENSLVDVSLRYKGGLNRYYGLIELAEEAGIFKKVATRIEVADGSKRYEEIMHSPEQYFTDEVMQKIDEYARRSLVMAVKYSFVARGHDILATKILEVNTKT